MLLCWRRSARAEAKVTFFLQSKWSTIIDLADSDLLSADLHCVPDFFLNLVALAIRILMP